MLHLGTQLRPSHNALGLEPNLSGIVDRAVVDFIGLGAEIFKDS
jgi:hypothetical protein